MLPTVYELEGETAEEHIRNALQMLEADFPEASRASLVGAIERLRAALRLL